MQAKHADATCVSLRHSNEGHVTCHLLLSRARVASLKPLTIPWLEIFACTIGARLAYTIREDLKLNEILNFYWAHSTNALFSIKQKENWVTFVSNRVNEIRKLSNPNDLESEILLIYPIADVQRRK